MIGILMVAAVAGFRAPATVPVEHEKGCLWLEAEAFADYGEWRLDTQFTHKMGSAYLIAPGVGKPIGSAKTVLPVPRAGTWHAWVRTKDWLPEFSPGRFVLTVNGKRSAPLGVSKREGWRWEKAGAFALPKGDATVSLDDLSGAFARCDAILFTTDATYVPPDGGDALEEARRKFAGEPDSIAGGGTYDVVVVGAGTAGMGAALAAARTGARTALVHDRPVLGGNSSVELGVGTDGAAGSHPNKKTDLRESGLCEEANLMKARAEPKTLSGAYRLMVDAEPRLTEIPNQRVLSVEKNGDRIAAAIARDTLTGRRTRVRGTIFIDCTGDGWVGVFAGADRMFGREAQGEYDEWPAPEARDNLTMSGCLMDGYLGYRYVKRGYSVPYETPPWANVLPPGFTRHIRSIAPSWWIEHGGRFDDVADPERARDELVRIVFAYWGWVKNVWEGRAEAANAEIVSVPFMNARREGYRLTGDYVLTANDALEGKLFPDRIAYGGWPLDTHDPLGMENPNGNGYWKHHPGVPTYTIPYRCLYSRNVSNLMFAGRCQSVTHIALGSVRVEATLFTLGQAAGTAAARACALKLSPREYGQKHITELQQRLLKDDQYIPELKNEDPLDLARKAKVSATSVKTCDFFGKNDPNLRPGPHMKPDRAVHDLTHHHRAAWFERGTLDRLEAVECLMVSAAEAPVPLEMRVWATDWPTNGTAGGELLATWRGTAPARKRAFVRFAGEGPVLPKRRYVWLEIGKTKGVSWLVRNRPIGPDDGRAWKAGKEWTIVKGEQYAFVATPQVRRAFDSRADYVIDGVSRPEGTCYHGWVSDPAQPLPQTLRLDFPKPVTAQEVRLTFDTDLTPSRVALNPFPRTLAKAYRVEGFDGTEWRTLAEENDNGLRLCIHRFKACSLSAVRVTVTETWGDPSARICEVRVY